MFRFTIALQGRELFTVEFGTPEPPAEPPGDGLLPNGAPEVEISRHGGDFTLGFGPPPPPVVQPVLRSHPTSNAQTRGHHTEE